MAVNEIGKEEELLQLCVMELNVLWATVTHSHWGPSEDFIKWTTELSTQGQNREIVSNPFFRVGLG